MLTPAEKTFVMHFNRESFTHNPGPAHAWLKGQDLPSTGAMAAFQYAHQESGEWDIHRELAGDIPTIEIPWASRQEFAGRVSAIMEQHPWLKTLPYAQVSP